MAGIFGNQSLNASSAPSGGGFYFSEGTYEIEVTAVKKVKTRSKGEMFLVETKVLESTNPTIAVGARPAWTQMLEGKAADVAPQNIKMFMTAAAGLNIFDSKDAKAIAEENWDAFGAGAIDDDQPLAGFRVHLEVFPKAPGKNYSKSKFTPSANPSDFQKKLIAGRK